ncbi:hypothetical protein ACFS07_15050 [Undibacterium arcticum]
MLQSILSGLDLLYKAQVLHRDISPENIMIQKKTAHRFCWILALRAKSSAVCRNH